MEKETENLEVQEKEDNQIIELSDKDLDAVTGGYYNKLSFNPEKFDDSIKGSGIIDI